MPPCPRCGEFNELYMEICSRCGSNLRMLRKQERSRGRSQKRVKVKRKARREEPPADEEIDWEDEPEPPSGGAGAGGRRDSRWDDRGRGAAAAGGAAAGGAAYGAARGAGRRGGYDGGHGAGYDDGRGRRGQYDQGYGARGQYDDGYGGRGEPYQGRGGRGQYDDGYGGRGQYDDGYGGRGQYDDGYGGRGGYDDGYKGTPGSRGYPQPGRGYARGGGRGGGREGGGGWGGGRRGGGYGGGGRGGGERAAPRSARPSGRGGAAAGAAAGGAAAGGAAAGGAVAGSAAMGGAAAGGASGGAPSGARPVPRGRSPAGTGGRGGRGRKGPRLITVFMVVLIFMIILCVLFLPPWGDTVKEGIKDMFGMNPSNLLPERTITYPKSLEFKAERTITIIPSTGTVTSWTYRAVAPTDIPPDGQIQDVLEVGVYPPPMEGYPDIVNHGGEDVKMTWEGGPLTSRYPITITYEMVTTTHDWDTSPASAYGTIDDIDINYTNTYVRQEWPIDDDNDNAPDVLDDGFGNTISHRIDPYNPKIQSLAQELSADKDGNTYEIARAFYSYLLNNVDYPDRQQMREDGVRYNNLPKYCTGTLADGRGDCDDQSITFISLCRAVGIPAWLELGYLYDKGAESWGGHGWANVYLPMPNATDGHIRAPVDVVNSQFLFRGAYRFTDAIDDGTVGYLDYFYNTFTYHYSSGFASAYFEDEFRNIYLRDEGKVVRKVPSEGADSRGLWDPLAEEVGSLPGFTGALLVVSLLTATASLVVLGGGGRKRMKGS